MVSIVKHLLSGFYDLIDYSLVENYETSMSIFRIIVGRKVSSNIIQLLKWEDKDNYDNYIRDINKCLYDIQRIRLKNGRKIRLIDHYDWIFAEDLSSIERVKNIIEAYSYNNSLKVIRTDEEVYKILTSIMIKVCKDIAEDNFENIENYL